MSLSQQPESPPPHGILTSSKPAHRFLQALHRWFRVNTFAPAWLGKRWGHPLIGISAAILSQVIVVSLKQLLVQAFPQAVFFSALSLLSVAIIALLWGVGPSIISTLFGALLLDMFILPSQSSFAFADGSAVLSVLVYLLAGFAISMLASQTERGRLTRERTEAQGKVVAPEEAADQTSQFLSLVSHELRTPVTTLKISIQLMLKRLEGMASDEQASLDMLLSLFQQQEHSLRRTDQQIRRLTHLLDDLIDLSRIRIGKLDIHSERCYLGALVREAVEVARLSYPDRSLALALPSDASVQVQADPDRIGQVLTNYLTNALKYSSADQPVEIGLEAQGQRARVWVRDLGPGIPPEEQEHVWELFHRVPGIEVKNGSGIGLGLGLYLSKMMIEQHHGEVGVESRPGQGSTFWFTLPLAPLDEPANTGQ